MTTTMEVDPVWRATGAVRETRRAYREACDRLVNAREGGVSAEAITVIQRQIEEAKRRAVAAEQELSRERGIALARLDVREAQRRIELCRHSISDVEQGSWRGRHISAKQRGELLQEFTRALGRHRLALSEAEATLAKLETGT